MIEKTNEINVGIGFATGRKNFKRVLRMYINRWEEDELTDDEKINLNLFVAYDLKYANTKSTDYTNINSKLLDMVDKTSFIGAKQIQEEIDYLVGKEIIDKKEAKLIFGKGYAGKRNIILYMALKQNIDYLIFLDDDEYPLAVTNTRSTAIWGGQRVLSTHLTHIKKADITNGHHCGYISPIPHIEFNDIMTENDFRIFIEAISNDIINWDKIKSVMKNGGVTYANTKILVSDNAEEVAETNHTKFISGSNLCINLTNPNLVNPFYNPPNARGEDTFLSTCLSNRKVLRVPCYTFHDGFSTYNQLLNGVLPVKLKKIRADDENNIERFYKACIGWIRYKPLLIYITQPNDYVQKMQNIREQLLFTLPKICRYFGRNDFMKVSDEFESYQKNVKKHYKQFINTQIAWEKIRNFFLK